MQIVNNHATLPPPTRQRPRIIYVAGSATGVATVSERHGPWDTKTYYVHPYEARSCSCGQPRCRHWRTARKVLL